MKIYFATNMIKCFCSYPSDQKFCRKISIMEKQFCSKLRLWHQLEKYAVVIDYINTMKMYLFLKVLVNNKLFSNYTVSSKQRYPFLTDSFSWLLCLCVSMLFNQLDIIQNWNHKSSSLYSYKCLPLYTNERIFKKNKHE